MRNTQNVRTFSVIRRFCFVRGELCIAGKWRIKVFHRIHIKPILKSADLAGLRRKRIQVGERRRSGKQNE